MHRDLNSCGAILGVAIIDQRQETRKVLLGRSLTHDIVRLSSDSFVLVLVFRDLENAWEISLF